MTSSVSPDLRDTPFAGLTVSRFLGEGHRCVAYAAHGQGKDLVLKAYHPRAAIRHARRCGESIAQYEYERNAAFRRVPQLAAHIASPIAFFSSPRVELFVQERVFGIPLPSFLRTASGECRESVITRLRSILECAHQARLFDLDLDSSNVIVKRAECGTAWPMLFDFNKVPYHVRPPNALFALLVKVGLIDRHARDYRKWQRLQRA